MYIICPKWEKSDAKSKYIFLTRSYFL